MISQKDGFPGVTSHILSLLLSQFFRLTFNNMVIFTSM